MVQKEDGTPDIQESGTFYCPEYSQLSQDVIGSGENVNVTVSVTNLSNNARATIGTYSFNFAEERYTCLSGGDPYPAFEAIGAFPEPETEATEPPPEYGETDPPVENPTTPSEQIPGQNGEWVNDEWRWYEDGVNGEWLPLEDGSYTWQWWW